MCVTPIGSIIRLKQNFCLMGKEGQHMEETKTADSNIQHQQLRSKAGEYKQPDA